MDNTARIVVRFEGILWRGFAEEGVLRFDYRRKDGRAIRFVVLPEDHVLFVRRPWAGAEWSYNEWFVHLVDAWEEDPAR